MHQICCQIHPTHPSYTTYMFLAEGTVGSPPSASCRQPSGEGKSCTWTRRPLQAPSGLLIWNSSVSARSWKRSRANCEPRRRPGEGEGVGPKKEKQGRSQREHGRFKNRM